MGAIRDVRRGLANRDGMALVEFALVLPIMLVLLLAGYELSNAIACNRKVTITSRAAADLTSQYGVVTVSQLNAILGASTQIMAPYSASNALVRVSEITVNSSNQATVTWSVAINGVAYKKGASYTLPSNLVASGVSYIVGDVNYAYTPVTGKGFIKPLGLSQSVTMLPRVSSSIPCGDCT